MTDLAQKRTRAAHSPDRTDPRKAITHADKRANLPVSGEDARDFVTEEMEKPVTLRYPRDTTLDPQLVWKGKDKHDAYDLVVDSPPIYIQEKSTRARSHRDARAERVNGASTTDQ